MLTLSDLRHRISICREIETSDDCGGYLITFEPFLEVWAEIKPIDSSEMLFYMKKSIETTHKILLRYNDAIKKGQKILFKNRSFTVKSVTTPNEIPDIMEILALELQI